MRIEAISSARRFFLGMPFPNTIGKACLMAKRSKTAPDGGRDWLVGIQRLIATQIRLLFGLKTEKILQAGEKRGHPIQVRVDAMSYVRYMTNILFCLIKQLYEMAFRIILDVGKNGTSRIVDLCCPCDVTFYGFWVVAHFATVIGYDAGNKVGYRSTVALWREI